MPGIIEESPSAFVFETPTGERIQVPKSGVSPDFAEQYRMPAPPAMLGPSAYVPPPMQRPSLMDRATDFGGNVLQTLGGMQDTARELKRNTVDQINPSIDINAPVDPNAASNPLAAPLQSLGHKLMPNSYAAPADQPPKAEEPAKEAGHHGEAEGGKLDPSQIHFQAPGASGPMGAAQSAAMGGFRPPMLSGAGMADAEKTAKQAYEERQKADELGVQLGQQKAAEEFGYRQEAMRKSAEMDAQATAANGAFQREYATKMKDFEKATDEFSKTDTKIDTHRVWSSMDGGQRVLAGIALALGAVGAAGNGGRNMAVETIDKAIDRDIDAQKAELSATLQKRGQAVNQKQNLLGMMREKFGDEIQLEAAARATLWKNVAATIESLGPKYQSMPEGAKLSLLQAKAAADGNYAEQKSIFAQRTNEIQKSNYALGMESQKLGMEGQRLELAIATAKAKGAGAPAFSSQPAADRLKAAAKDSVTSPQKFDAAVDAFALAAATDFSKGKAPKPATVEMFKDMVKKRWRATGSIDNTINATSQVLREARAAAVSGAGDAVDVGEEG